MKRQAVKTNIKRTVPFEVAVRAYNNAPLDGLHVRERFVIESDSDSEESVDSEGEDLQGFDNLEFNMNNYREVQYPLRIYSPTVKEIDMRMRNGRIGWGYGNWTTQPAEV